MSGDCEQSQPPTVDPDGSPPVPSGAFVCAAPARVARRSRPGSCRIRPRSCSARFLRQERTEPVPVNAMTWLCGPAPCGTRSRHHDTDSIRRKRPSPRGGRGIRPARRTPSACPGRFARAHAGTTRVAPFGPVQGDRCQQHAERPVPQGGQGDHAGDRHRPASIRRCAPHHDRRRDRQARHQRDRHRGPRPVPAGDRAQDREPLRPGAGHEHRGRGHDHPGRHEGGRELVPFAPDGEPQQPDPGVTLVRSTNPHAAGQRKPTTIATAMRISMLPPAKLHRREDHPEREEPGPVRKRTPTSRTSVQTAMNACHGRRVSGAMSWMNAGE